MKKKLSNAFTLIELMIVVAIIAFLAMIAMPSFMRIMGKAKRSEVYLNLGSIYAAEKAYWAENGQYASILKGQDGIGWEPEGEIHYTYGFPGSEGVNYFSGKLKGSAVDLSQAKADKDSFIVSAVADINGKKDVITINEKKEIKIVEDALK